MLTRREKEEQVEQMADTLARANTLLVIDYLGLSVRRVPVAEDFRADVAAMREAVTPRTLMIVGSAPCFPYGLIDSIGELSELAIERDLWLHVDACVGGYFAPFARMNGIELDDFDFSLPGVRSMS